MLSRREFVIRPLQAALCAEVLWQVSLLPLYLQYLITAHNSRVLSRTDLAERQQVLAPGLEYHKVVLSEPRKILAHLIIVDRTQAQVRVRSHANAGMTDEAVAQQTSAALKTSSASVAVAVNANFFAPFRASLPGLQFPRAGDEVSILGQAIVAGQQISSPQQGYPAFCVAESGDVSIVEMECATDTVDAVAGNKWLVQDGVAVTHSSSPAPRTAIGISAEAIYLVVADGRQPGYSEGMKLEELGVFLARLGVDSAINLDGGGSSTLALKLGSQISILNSSIDHGIVGYEREVANQLVIELLGN